MGGDCGNGRDGDVVITNTTARVGLQPYTVYTYIDAVVQ